MARWFVIAAFLTGAASFMYELGWIRMLSLVLGSSTHSFELMLSAFIFGLAFGGLHVRKRIERMADPEKYLGGIMLAMGALRRADACLRATDVRLHGMVTRHLYTYTRWLCRVQCGQPVHRHAIMFPATFCAGMTLPVLTYALMRRGMGEKAIGTIYSVNTAGAIAGVLLTVHVLMPLIGVKGCHPDWRGYPYCARAFAPDCNRCFRFWRPLGGCDDHASLGFDATFVSLIIAWPRGCSARVTQPCRPANVTFLRDGKTATITLVEYDGRVQIGTNGKPDAVMQTGKGPLTADDHDGSGRGDTAQSAPQCRARG